MKSRRIKEIINKKENAPQEQKSNMVISRKYKSHVSPKGTEQVTVKETTIEKSYKKTYNKIEEESHKNISNVSSSMKQGISSGLSSEKKDSIQNKEDSAQSKFHKYGKYAKYKSMRKEKESTEEKKYTKKEIELIIKIQRWWKRVLARINGYKIREKLKKEKGYNFASKSKEVVREKYSSYNNISHKYESSNNKSTTNKNISSNNYKIVNNKNNINSTNSNTSSYSNINSYSNSNFQKNQNSKSYNNINSIKTTVKNNLNINTNMKTSSSQNNIQTMSKKLEYPKYTGSMSTSPSIKSKYIIETKKVEYFKKPKNYSVNKTMNTNTLTSMSEINRYEVKEIMHQIWNEESYCSTVESLCCLSDKMNESQNNTMIFEEYEEEIRRLKTLLMEKDEEINNLMANLKENQLNVKYSTTYKEYNSNKNVKDMNDLQLITKKSSNWNEVNLPSPVSEIFIKSFMKNYNSDIAAYNMEKYTQKIKEESIQETISDSEAVLEIQEMNSLSIISNIKKPKNICQHLQSLMILSKKNEDEEQFIFQKIEEINITSIINKQKNSIQELDGLEIISMKKPSMIKEPFSVMIQELDGLEILKSEKAPNAPQCVDEFEIPREYDMLLVKPTWNSLQIQGSGLNLLAMPRDMGLENQEIDEFEILGKDKPIPTKRIQPIEIAIIDKIELKGKEIVIEKKEVIGNEIVENERFNIKKTIIEEIVPVKRKGFVEKINKKIITKKEEKKEEEVKPEIKPLEINNIESIEIKREYETPQPIVLEKIDWNKMVRPIKSTKLVIRGKEVKVEKEELVTESFAFNIAETNNRFKNLIIYENGGFDIEGNKGMILKEGPAQTIQIKKEQILLPSKSDRFDLINEIKKPELIITNENRIQINSQYQVKMDPKENIKIIEKVVEKKINWNEFNIIEHNDFNLIQKKSKIELIKQASSIITLLGEEMPQQQKEKIIQITKDWNDLLKIQRFAKFGLLGKPKQSKKYKLLVANGDKFFIQKESDDEIIYNDDYNTRKQKKKSEKKEKAEIIKEKEIIPRYQREIRAQIARVRESESETSSLSEIDVLAGIRNKSVIGVGGAEKELLRLKMANGYETKVLNGEVVFTSKNELGINLGGSQYQKQFRNKINYTKKLSPSFSNNKMTGIEINFNPKIKSGVRFEKMSATSGIIGEGNYKILSNRGFDIENNGGQIKKKIIMTSTENNEINGQSNIILNNRLTGQKSASNLLIRRRESGKSNETPISVNINNETNKQIKIGNIIFNSKKSEKGPNSPNSAGNMSEKNNIIINARKEQEKRIVMSGDRNNKNVEIKFKKSKVKNIEPLREYDSQNSY